VVRVRLIGFLFWFAISLAGVDILSALIFHDIRFFIWASSAIFGAFIYRLVLKKGGTGGKS
jgi:hypothetical protein